MPARLIEETLHAWREAERLLQELPPLEPDHETVRIASIRLQATYQRLSGTRELTADVLADCRATLEQVRATLLGLGPTTPLPGQ